MGQSSPARQASVDDASRPRRDPQDLKPAKHGVPVRPSEGIASFASLIRPSDRRGPGQDPRPQCAFEKSVLNVSCNSHQVSQLAAFFIDP
jgi:hypothetical protein